MKTNRRNFIKKAGLVLGATTLVGSTQMIPTSSLIDHSILANEEQVQLLIRFEKWVNEYIEVIESEKIKNREFKNNQALTAYPSEIEKWMPEIKKHLGDKQFATEYLKVSSKLTQSIDPRF